VFMEAIEEVKGEKERGRGVVSYTREGKPSPLKVDHHLILHHAHVAHRPLMLCDPKCLRFAHQSPHRSKHAYAEIAP
ncbi:hypothetical protein E4U16_003668, partial [Claviceps sp. LM84 group G4]